MDATMDTWDGFEIAEVVMLHIGEVLGIVFERSFRAHPNTRTVFLDQYTMTEHTAQAI